MFKKLELLVTNIKSISPGLAFIFLGLWLTYTRRFYPNWCNFKIDMGPHHDLFGILSILVGIFVDPSLLFPDHDHPSESELYLSSGHHILRIVLHPQK